MSAGSDEALPEQIVDAKNLVTRRRKWLLIATFFVAYALATFTVAEIHQRHVESQRLAAKILAQGYAQRIQERLHSALISTYVLSSIVKQSRGQVENFEAIAAELITLFPSVSALQLAPDGVIRESYPLRGNEAAIGHDLLADRARNREAAEAVTTQQLTLAGPFDLIQGGVGAVGRMPVFMVNERGESHFWGFANALIKIQTLIEAAGLSGLTNAGYFYELWRINPDTEQRQVFVGSSERPLVGAVEYVITVFGGRWILSIAPSSGWISTSDYVEIFGYSLVVALIVTLLQYFCLRALLAVRDR